MRFKKSKRKGPILKGNRKFQKIKCVYFFNNIENDQVLTLIKVDKHIKSGWAT